jgi:hypothetical protein
VGHVVGDERHLLLRLRQRRAWLQAAHGQANRDSWFLCSGVNASGSQAYSPTRSAVPGCMIPITV